jgi:hypothetical protein
MVRVLGDMRSDGRTDGQVQCLLYALPIFFVEHKEPVHDMPTCIIDAEA